MAKEFNLPAAVQQMGTHYGSKAWDIVRIYCSFFLSLSFSHSKVVIKKSSNDNFVLKMIKFSLKLWCFHSNPFFEPKKLSFDDFLMTTWERENESERKKEPEIPCLWLLCRVVCQWWSSQEPVEAGFQWFSDKTDQISGSSSHELTICSTENTATVFPLIVSALARPWIVFSLE